MRKEYVQKFIVPSIYVVAGILLIVSVFYIQNTMNGSKFNNKNEDPVDYIPDNIINNDTPVNTTDKVIIRPYTSSDVMVARNFYDYQSEKDTQVNSLIFFENTYMQNSGVDYRSDSVFDVVAILDGVVLNVKEDELLGNIVEIRHNNEMISIYQSLSEVSVKKDENVVAGNVIGKSGTNNINSSLGNHLHFELFYKGKVVNPEIYYDKKIVEL